MSYTKIRSMSRILKTEDGKFTVEATGTANNVFPLDWHKFKFPPYDSEEELVGSILEGIWGGMLQFQCKSKYKTFMDEVRYGICKSPALDKISRLRKWHDYIWHISSMNKHWNAPNANHAMREKRDALQAKLQRCMDALWIPLAREFAQWKPCTDRFTIRIDGNRIVQYRYNAQSHRSSWKYVPYENVFVPSKVFTATEAAIIKERLKDRAILVPASKADCKVKAA